MKLILKQEQEQQQQQQEQQQQQQQQREAEGEADDDGNDLVAPKREDLPTYNEVSRFSMR